MEAGSSLRRFLAELKRRHVYRVAAVYAATAFVVIQIADLTFVRLGLPAWSVTFVIALAGLGLPIALVLAWAFEVTPEGVRRTEPAVAEVQPLGIRPVLGLLTGFLVVGALGWWLVGPGTGSATEIDRVAVLPFGNLMDDPEHDFFVQGMHSELISELQQAGVPVIARTSVLRYGDGETPARQIARQLEVDALVEATVLRTGDSVEVDASLVDPSTEEYLWSASFSGDLRDVENLHRGMTRAIARAIQAVLDADERARLEHHSEVDPRAYDAYLRGVVHSQRFTPQDLATALDYFERALAIDSTYAPAHLGVARVWAFRAQAGFVPATEARAHADPAVARARELGGSLAREPMATTGAGLLAWGDWKFEEAEEAFRRAIELNGEHPETRMFYAHLLTILGRWEEAERQAGKAMELDPLNPFIRGLYGTQRYFVRQHDEAIRILEELFADHPGAGFGRSPLAAAYHLSGRPEEAVRVLSDAAGLRGDTVVRRTLSRGASSGDYRAAHLRAAKALAALREDAYPVPVRVATHYAYAGREQESVAWLHRAFEARDQNVPYVGVSPHFEALHDRPRFRELARAVGVPLLTGPREE